MFKKIKKNQKGFTLIELIVVIAILGILAAIAIPRMSGFTDKAKIAADEQLMALLVNNVNLLIAEGTLENTAATSILITNTATGGVSATTPGTFTDNSITPDPGPATTTSIDASLADLLDITTKHFTFNTNGITIAVPAPGGGDATATFTP